MALAHGIKVSANIVVPDHTHIPRVLRIIEEYGRNDRPARSLCLPGGRYFERDRSSPASK
jgi:hypothetical protein